ncbi:MAG: prephenate dehydratase [Alphaproteobacteria bacterium]|nr:prephenate dehydratase [Alphaproteobacteria bacterium]
MASSRRPSSTIVFQGMPGAYSHLACRHAFPDMHALPQQTFEDMFAAVHEGRAKYAMTPIENSVAGRVADIHRLMPESGLHIVSERFLRVNHHLLAPKGATMKSIRIVRSHVHALSQCRGMIRKLGLQAIVHADTAGAAAELAERGDVTEAAIASSLAGEIYGLKSLRANIEDADHNTTRFVVLARRPVKRRPDEDRLVTTFVFRVRNVPAALYKALGGFATNGVNMTKLESYMVGGSFNATQFYADVEGHPEDRPLKLALEELAFFTHEVRIVGTYPADPFRFGGRPDETD